MNRKSLATRGVFFAYGALAAQIIYSLATIPLTLSFLSIPEFGMWSLIVGLTAYLNYMELGMGKAFQRLLFECKNQKENGRYGRLFVASLLALGIASLLALITGIALVWVASPVFDIPTELKHDFFWVMTSMVVLTSATLATRMAGAPLYVHQRHDLMQFSQIILYVILFVTLFLGLHAGWGMYALPASHAAGFVWGNIFNLYTCYHLKFYPPKGTYKIPSRAEWSSVLRYSRDLFILQVGNGFADGLPLLLIPRLLGLEALAVWTVCTRPFKILKQLVSKPYQIALPMLLEMHISGNNNRMSMRWANVTQLIAGVAVCTLSVGAANNGHFIHLWVGEQMQWSEYLNWLVALYFLSAILLFSIIGTIGFRKHFGHIRFVPYAEIILMTANALWMVKLWGLAGLIVAAITAKIPTRFYFGLKYLSNMSKTPIYKLCLNAIARPLSVVPLTVAASWSCTHLSSLLPGYGGLLLSATCGTLLAGSVVLLFGVSRGVRSECIQMALKPLSRLKIIKANT